MPIKLVVNAAPSAVENPDGGSVWKKKFSLISYSAVAGGRELVELCPAAMPALNTSNGVLLSLGRPTTAKTFFSALAGIVKPLSGLCWCCVMAFVRKHSSTSSLHQQNEWRTLNYCGIVEKN